MSCLAHQEWLCVRLDKVVGHSVAAGLAVPSWHARALAVLCRAVLQSCMAEVLGNGVLCPVALSVSFQPSNYLHFILNRSTIHDGIPSPWWLQKEINNNAGRAAVAFAPQQVSSVTSNTE